MYHYIQITHAYANPIVACASSARAKVYTMLHQTEWCYSDSVVKQNDGGILAQNIETACGLQ